MREVIGRRVERLGADARTALSAAAVIGRDFDLDLLLAVVELSEDQLLDLLEEAVAASLLNESSEHAGRFTFTHALVEHTLYEDLGARVAPAFTGGSPKRSRSSAAMSPASGSASSPATGPRRS